MADDGIHIDTALLEGYMSARGCNASKMAELSGMSEKRINDILKNIDVDLLKYKDINAIVNILEIPKDDAVKIFF